MDKIKSLPEESETETTQQKYKRLKTKAMAFGLNEYEVYSPEDYKLYQSRWPNGQPPYDQHLDFWNEELRNPLIGAVCIHGFNSNLKASDKRKAGIDEESTLRKVVEKGAIVSPGRRQLVKAENIRVAEADFDRNRICLEARTGSKKDGGADSYIGNLFFAVPVPELGGNVLTEDPAFGKESISVYHENGVEIGLEKGVMFTNLDLFLRVYDDIVARADKLGINLKEYLNKCFRVTPSNFPLNPKNFWRLITQTINPVTNIRYQPMPIVAISRETQSGKNFIEVVRELQPVAADQLGQSDLIPGTLLGLTETRREIETLYETSFEQLDEYLKILTKDNKALCDYPGFFDIKKIQAIHFLLETTSPDDELIPRLGKLIEFHQKLYKYDQERLAKLNPSAGSYKEESKKGNKNFVYRNKNGNYCVEHQRTRPPIDDI